MKTIQLLTIFCIGAISFIQGEANAQPKNLKPRIITESQVKNFWIKRFPIPRTLARNYHQQMRNYSALVANIKAGNYDYDAKVRALAWNIKEYQRVRDFQMANQSRQDLHAIVLQEEERKKTAALQAQAAAAENSARAASRAAVATNMELQRLEQQLFNIQIQLQSR